MMELNTKSPFTWDWDNLVVLPSRTVELPKKLQLVDSEFDAIDGFEIGPFHSGESSDLAFGSSSKSSKSASVSDCLSQDPSNRKEMVNSITEISIDSGESLIGLRLGKRTYFENAAGANNGKTSASVPRRSKASTQSAEIQRCQVEGCNLDLSSAKDYHRKHRVCENHSKSPKVVICGVERRFCQQCSRFHSLSEFDQRKRSCRRRLSDHNARRRKPKPEIIQFNSVRMPSSLHVGAEGRSQMSLGFNQVSTGQTMPNGNATWDFTSNSELTQEKVGLFQSTKSGGVYAANAARSVAQETGFKVSFGSPPLLPAKSATSEAFHRGFHVSTTSTTTIGAARNVGALSLLSTSTWAPCSQQQGPDSALHQTGVLSHDHRTRLLDQPPDYWHGDQPPAPRKTANANHFQEFRLFEMPAEPGFYSYEDLR